MEVELLQDAVDQIGLSAVLVDAIEGVTRSLHRQHRDVNNLQGGKNSGDPGREAKTNVVELTELLDRRVNNDLGCSFLAGREWIRHCRGRR